MATEVGDIHAQWERIQIKTFTAWANMHLAKRCQKIDSILTDFQDGVKLADLLEIIGDGSIKINKNPKFRLHKIENLGKCLRFIEEHDVKLASIGPEAIVDGMRVQTLGMVWTIILRFAIAGLSAEGISAKQGLLMWCQKKTEGYRDVNVQDFQDSFKDGLAFCAIIHRHRPELIDYDSLDKNNARDNLNTAFDVAAKNLDIPRLLDVDDIVDMPKPDERSIMTYCAALYKVFSSYDKVETAGRRIAKFLNFVKAAEGMINDYARRAQILRDAVEAKRADLGNAAMPDSYEGGRAALADFRAYKNASKRQWVVEHSDLVALFSNIQSKLKTMNRPAYMPPTGLAPEEIGAIIDELTTAERKHHSALNARMRQILDTVRQGFAKPANAFFERLMHYKGLLAGPAEGDLPQQVQFFQDNLQAFTAELEQQLPVIQAAEEQCSACNIEDNEYSDHTFEDLQFTFEQLRSVFAKKIQFTQDQINESKGGVPLEKMNEFRESFEHFDGNHDGQLDKLELKSALSSLGLVDVSFGGGEDKEFEAIFAKVSEGHNQISLEQYVKYMVSITEDTVSPQQLAEAFTIVSGSKTFLTEADLRKAQLTDDQVDFVKTSFPATQGGYDHKAWLSAHNN
eukprot:TRINITY_DN18745_c0_g1_i1.p1 TRINITY_DN18745_c0_g1~~TRINITY_DN18745_c0_g1_i1.p1  ORF type:complete len:626 (+),score=222.66 TRINITY_DN18745_c0_g1_i1:58-1935(+)